MKLKKVADVEERRRTVVPDGWHTVVATLAEFTGIVFVLAFCRDAK
jgi:hypothetical protein